MSSLYFCINGSTSGQTTEPTVVMVMVTVVVVMERLCAMLVSGGGEWKCLHRGRAFKVTDVVKKPS